MSFGNGKKIGLALGGGAARGLAHIGVLKVLEKHHISPDVIVGTSMGALIGALYAGGISISDIEQFALRLNSVRLAFLADMTPSFGGLVGGRRVVSMLKSIMGDLSFSQLKLDFACVSTDIITGAEVVLRDGSLLEAVRASVSLPGIFTPVKFGKQYLVDGGLVNEVPVSVCREMGAEYVIGVNVLPHPSRTIGASLRKREAARTPVSVEPAKAEDVEKPTALSHVHNQFLRSRLTQIDTAIQSFLLYRQPAMVKKAVLKPVDWLRVDMPKRLRRTAPSLVDVLSQTLAIAEYRVAVENLKDADLVISPDMESIGFWQFTKASESIKLGEEAADRALKQLLHSG